MSHHGIPAHLRLLAVGAGPLRRRHPRDPGVLVRFAGSDEGADLPYVGACLGDGGEGGVALQATGEHPLFPASHRAANNTRS